jgi:hypothetical protein
MMGNSLCLRCWGWPSVRDYEVSHTNSFFIEFLRSRAQQRRRSRLSRWRLISSALSDTPSSICGVFAERGNGVRGDATRRWFTHPLAASLRPRNGSGPCELHDRTWPRDPPGKTGHLQRRDPWPWHGGAARIRAVQRSCSSSHPHRRGFLVRRLNSDLLECVDDVLECLARHGANPVALQSRQCRRQAGRPSLTHDSSRPRITTHSYL